MKNTKKSSFYQKLYFIPRTPFILSVLSIIPFSICSLSVWFLRDPWQSFAFLNLLNYSVIVLSFLGAVQWGISLSRNHNKLSDQWHWYVWSVIPALVCWLVLMGITNYMVVILIFMLGFTISYFVDSYSVRMGRIPQWYGTVRKILTSIVLIHLGSVMIYINRVTI